MSAPLTCDPAGPPEPQARQARYPNLKRGGQSAAPLLAAPRCSWCRRNAMAKQVWCWHHRPGPRPRIEHPTMRGPRPPAGALLARLAAWEGTARRLASPAILAWPPVTRILARPVKERGDTGVRHVLAAVLADATGDAGAWPDMLSRLQAAGLLAPGDPDRPGEGAPAPRLASLLDIEGS